MSQLEEHQRRAFASYGEVMARVGAVEHSLRLALAKHELDRCRRGAAEFDGQKLGRKILGWDFGTLLQQVADKFRFVPELRTALKDARGLRDYLAHNFCPIHFVHLRTEAGLTMIERECTTYGRQFDLAGLALVHATGVDLETYTQFLNHQAQNPLPEEWEVKLKAVEDEMAKFEGSAFANGPSIPLIKE